MRSLLFAAALVAVSLSAACEGCGRVLPTPPAACDPASLAQNKGCLPDEVCVEGACQPLPPCEGDDECPSLAYRCSFPAQVCTLRPGFGEECDSVSAPCDPGLFCSLGVCRVIEEAFDCIDRLDCRNGQMCDKQARKCVPDAPCTLSSAYPEASCDPGETCDSFSGRCTLGCVNECSVETVEEDCSPGQLCDPSCRCVQCIGNDDCGAGLVCNTRSGRCQSEDLCFSNADCEPPLECSLGSGQCEVPPPACENDFDCPLAELCNRDTGRCALPGGECDEDRFEGNSTPQTAEEIELDPGETRTIDELQLCPDADDVFEVPLLAGDTLTATVSGAEPLARATVWLLDSEGASSLRFSETPPRGDGSIVYTAQVDESVYVRVNALLAQTPYELTLSRGSGAVCPPDFFEGAGGNDSRFSATLAPPVGPTLNAAICPGDVDHYSIDVAAGEAITTTVTFNATAADLDVAYLDSVTGAVIAQSSGLFQPEVVRRRFTSARTLIVRVRGFGNDNAPYQIRFERTPPFACVADDNEPDNDIASAVAVPTQPVFGPVNRTACLDDADHFAVDLEDFERLVLTATYVTTDGDLDLDVIDGAGVLLKRAPTSSVGAALTYDARGDERVYVRARGRLGAALPYALSMRRENQAGCVADAAEPNNTVATRSAVPPVGTLLQVCGSDQDFFAVEGTGGKVLQVSASFLHDDGDLDLMVLGLDGQQILAVADGTDDGEVVEALLPLDGVYTVRVFSLTNNANATYTLETALLDP